MSATVSAVQDARAVRRATAEQRLQKPQVIARRRVERTTARPELAGHGRRLERLRHE
jgi:hypothetical protein